MGSASSHPCLSDKWCCSYWAVSGSLWATEKIAVTSQFISSQRHGTFPAPNMDDQWAQDGCSQGNVEFFLPRTFQAPCLARCSPLSEAAKRPLFSPLGDITVSLSTHGGRPLVQWLGSQKFFPLDMDWDGKGLDTVGENNVGERSQK